MRSIHPMMLRRPMILHRCAAAVSLLVLSIGVLGCPQHDDFPTALDLVVPPTPTDFVITDEGPNPAGGHDYNLSWTISDATSVDRYRIYVLDIGAPQLEAETTNTALDVTFPFQSSGLRMSVAAVSTGNVEGGSRVGVTP